MRRGASPRPKPDSGSAKQLSVVIIARNEGAELTRTIESFQPTLPKDSEILVIDDGGNASLPNNIRVLRTPHLGVAGARNFGANRTRGDVLVFADAHIRVPENWWQPLVRTLCNPKVAAVAPAVRNLRRVEPSPTGYGLTFTGPDLEVKWLPRAAGGSTPVPILPGCCLAMTRATFNATGGWDGGLLQRGGVDNEMSLRLWLLGYELRIVPEVEIRHLFRKHSPFPVGWTQYLHNRLRLALVHLTPGRLGRVVSALSAHDELGAALALAVDSGVAERRRQVISQRKRNDDWYFARFGLEW